MLFNSLDFAVFLPVVFILYWFVAGRNLKLQNLLIVVASYVFYGWWDWRFLFLIIFSTLVDYSIGLLLAKPYKQPTRLALLWVSIAVNIGLLGFFKYYNFFVDNFTTAFTFFGREIQANSLHIILPVGISFYTFQSLSYTIDVYRRKLEPTRDLTAFAAFVAFFPQLVAGPIERATNLLPQFFSKRKFNADQAVIGVKQIIWGLFKKVVIADACAHYVDEIFSQPGDYSSLTLGLGAVYFSIQIYCDFSGYSDIAIGTARLFNFRLMVNFRYPYFARDIAEFWRRWHISLSSWFRDYVYIPLGGNRITPAKQIRNVFIVFLVGGLWHGANWTFIIWGAFHAFLFLPLVFYRPRYLREIVGGSGLLPSLKEVLQMAVTFGSVTFGLIVFRAASLGEALAYIKGILELDLAIETLVIQRYAFEMLPFIGLLLLIEWFSRHQEFPLATPKYSLIKVSLLLAMILVFGSFSEMKEFIYFQF